MSKDEIKREIEEIKKKEYSDYKAGERYSKLYLATKCLKGTVRLKWFDSF